MLVELKVNVVESKVLRFEAIYSSIERLIALTKTNVFEFMFHTSHVLNENGKINYKFESHLI